MKRQEWELEDRMWDQREAGSRVSGRPRSGGQLNPLPALKFGAEIRN